MFLRMNKSRERQAVAPKQQNNVNVTSHILRRYTSGGSTKLPSSAGGLAFAKALADKGISVTISS